MNSWGEGDKNWSYFFLKGGGEGVGEVLFEEKISILLKITGFLSFMLVVHYIFWNWGDKSWSAGRAMGMNQWQIGDKECRVGEDSLYPQESAEFSFFPLCDIG